MQELPPSTSTTEDTSNWSQPVEGALGCPLPWPTAGGLPWRRDAPAQSRRGDGFQQKSMPKPPSTTVLNGSCGEPTRSTPQPGGQSCLQAPEKEMWKNLPGSYGPHSNCLRGGVASRVPQMITLHPLSLMTWARISSSWLRTCILEARIIDWNSQRRPWPMHRPCSTGQKKPSHHAWANPTN